MMNPISFPRKITLYLIEIGIQVLWVVDRITNFDLEILLRYFKSFCCSE